MNESTVEKRRRILIYAAYFALVLGVLIFFFRVAIFKLMPFVFGLIVAMILRPVMMFFQKKCRFGRGAASVVTLVLFYCTIGVLLVFVALELAELVQSLLTMLPSFFTDTVIPALTRWADRLTALAVARFPQFVPEIEDAVADLSGTLTTGAAELSKSLLSSVASLAAKTPGFLLNVVISVISSFFIAYDYVGITRFLLRQLKPESRELVLRVKNELGTTLVKYIRSYSLIMLITFGELWVGLMCVGVEKAYLYAIVIAVFDILPVIGSGLFLAPWCVVSFVIGKTGQGIGLAILFAVLIVVRNIIEPRIVGTQVGLPPIATLMAMVVGTWVFGGIGLLGLPVALAIIKSLNDQGFIRLYKENPEGEPEEKKPGLIERLLKKLFSKKKTPPEQEA